MPVRPPAGRRLLLALAALAGLAGGGPSPLDDVLARHLAARGGRERLEAVASARVRGMLTLGPGVTSPFLLEWRRPDQLRLDVEILGEPAVQAFDGETAWTQSGDEPPERLPDSAIAGMRRQADLLGGPLLAPPEAGHRVELLGRLAAPDGADSVALAVELAGGEHLTIHLDPESLLETAQRSEQRVDGEAVTVATTTFADYRTVGGLLLPFLMITRLEGAPPGAEAQRLVVDEWELDVPIEPARFAPPAGISRAPEGED